MKVVLLHDWLNDFRGGERVLETLCEIYPDAPIYTLIHKKDSTSKLIESKTIKTSILNKIPGILLNYKKFLPFMPLAVKTLKIPDDTDIMISSSHCVIKGVKKPKNCIHICYIHSPMRYMYDQFDNYFRNAPFDIKVMAHIFRPYLKWWDKKSNSNVDYFISNSNFVQKRIQRYYERTSNVIYPFVDLTDFKDITPTKKEDYYVMVTAFAPNKRLDIAIEAFKKLDQKLKIVGKATKKELAYFQKMAGPQSQIEFLGDLTRQEVIDHLTKAKAFIFPGIEDFGITPLEAMASGTPVIAFKKGGVLETVTENTGIFFHESTPESLIAAIKNFEHKQFNFEHLVQRANRYSKENFVKKFVNLTNSFGE